LTLRDRKLSTGDHEISNPLLEMKRVTGDGSGIGRCKKLFGQPRAIRAIEHVENKKGVTFSESGRASEADSG
jgi:hypothetical protein